MSFIICRIFALTMTVNDRIMGIWRPDSYRGCGPIRCPSADIQSECGSKSIKIHFSQ